jgi:hypothetical protein
MCWLRYSDDPLAAEPKDSRNENCAHAAQLCVDGDAQIRP